MSYPKNADEVLGLNGLKFATALSFVQMAVVFFFFVRTTTRLTETQFSAIPQPLVISAVFILLSSLAVTLALATTSAKRAYKKYDQKAKFELILRGLLDLVATSGSTPRDAKLAFANEYLDALTSDVAQAHLEHLPNRQGKQLLRDAVLGMQINAGNRILRHVEDSNGIPSSGVMQKIETDLGRLEVLYKALNKAT